MDLAARPRHRRPHAQARVPPASGRGAGREQQHDLEVTPTGLRVTARRPPAARGSRAPAPPGGRARARAPPRSRALCNSTSEDSSSSSRPCKPQGKRTRRVPWADFLSKVLAVGVLACRCGRAGFSSSPSSPRRRLRGASSITSASTPGGRRSPAPRRRPTCWTAARATTAPTSPSRNRRALPGQANLVSTAGGCPFMGRTPRHELPLNPGPVAGRPNRRSQIAGSSCQPPRARQLRSTPARPPGHPRRGFRRWRAGPGEPRRRGTAPPPSPPDPGHGS